MNNVRMTDRAHKNALFIKNAYGCKSISEAVELATDRLVQIDKLVKVDSIEDDKIIGFGTGTDTDSPVTELILLSGEDLNDLYIGLTDEIITSKDAYLSEKFPEEGLHRSDHSEDYKYLKTKHYIYMGKSKSPHSETMNVYFSPRLSKQTWDRLSLNMFGDDKNDAG